MSKITQKTWVPISLVGSAGASIIGGVFWLSTMYAQGNENSKNIEKLTGKQERMQDQIAKDLSEIKEDVSEIKGILKRK